MLSVYFVVCNFCLLYIMSMSTFLLRVCVHACMCVRACVFALVYVLHWG